MAQYDGIVRINTEIEYQNAKKELKSLESSITKTANEIASLRSKMDALKNAALPTDRYQEISEYLKNAENEFDKLLQKQEQMQAEGKDSGDAWNALSTEIVKVGMRIKIAEQDLQSLVDSGKAFASGFNSDEYAQISAQMQQLNQQMQADTERQAELQSQIAEREERLAELRENAVVGNQRIIETADRIKQLEQEIADLKAAGITEGYQDYDSRIQELSELKQEIKDYNNGIDETKERYRQLSSVAENSLKQISKSVSRYAIAPFKLLGSIAKKAFSNIGKGSKSSNTILNGGFKNILKYGLGIRSLYVAFNKLRSAIKEGFTNLYNDKNITKFKNSVDSLKASILTLKNSFAAAFRPVVEMAIPYIQKLADYMTQLLETVSQFMAAITGQKKYTKAIKQTADAFKDAEKAADGYLSPLDEVNKYQTSKSATADAGSGGAMFEEVPLGDNFKDISQWLKDMWESADFTELGTVIGKKIKSALDSIPWENVKKSAKKIGGSIATLINGGVETAGLGYSIGDTLAQAINTGFENLNAFVHELHWDSVGTFIADSLNGLFGNVDWDLIKDTFVTGVKGLASGINSFISDFNWDNVSGTISNVINTITESVYTLLSNIEWKNLGQKIGDQLTKSIKKINWKQVGEAIGSVIQTALDFLEEFVKDLDFGEVAQAVVDTLEGFFGSVDVGQLASIIVTLLAAEIAIKATASLFAEAGKAILKALGKAIISSAGTISGMASSLLASIGAAFTSLGGIGGILTADLAELIPTLASAGTAAEIGVTIGTGILGGLAGAFVGGAIGQLLDNYILGPIISFFDADLSNYFKNFKWFGEGGFFEFLSTTTWEENFNALDQMMTDFSNNKFMQFLNGDISGLMGKEHKTWKETKEEVLGAITKIKEEAPKIWAGFMDGIDTISDWFKNSVKPWFTVEKWTRLFQNIMSSAVKIGYDLKNWWDSDVSPWISGTWGGIKRIFEGFITFLSGAFTGDWKKAWSGIIKIFSGVEDSFKSTANLILGILESLVNGAINGINVIISALEDFATIKNPFTGEVVWSLNLPKIPQANIPRLATGTVVPPNREFMAVLGDNKREPEVVSPISTIEEAVINAMAKVGAAGGNAGGKPVNITVQVVLDRKVLGQSMIDWGKIQQMATGNNPYSLGTT